MKVYLIFLSILISVNIFAVDERAEEFYNEGLNYFKNGNFEGAIVEFENAVNLDSDYFFIMSSDRMFEKFLSSNSENVFKEVEKVCSHLINSNINETDPFVLYYLGWSMLKQKRYKDASKYLTEAVKKMDGEGLNSDIAQELLKEIK